MNQLAKLDLHPEFTIQKQWIGESRAPLLVIDNFVAWPNELINLAGALKFSQNGRAFPGIRVAAPLIYQRFILEQLGPVLVDHFQLGASKLRFSMCHYSLVTTPPEKLTMVQRIPHVDAFDGNGLAGVHYLFKDNLGGTAFYRHRKTGFEYLDEARKLEYFKSLEAENGGGNIPPPEYINGDTALFQQIEKVEGVFNRMVIYRRNILHSGCIDKSFVPDPSPYTGRLSLNSFIDILP